MKVYLRTADDTLADLIRTGNLHHQGGRCLHSKLPIPEKDEFQTMTLLFMMFRDAFSDILEGTIFLHETGDLLMIFEGRAAPLVERFNTLVSTMFDISKIHTDVYELNRDWDAFSALAEQIINAQKNLAREEKPALPSNLNAGFMQKIHQVRDKRARPLALLVEDDNFTKGILITLLQSACDVITATTLSHALALYQQKLPNMVFMDIELPDGSGMEATRTITASDPNAYIIMLSGHTMRENILHSLDNGAKGFIAKPFTKDRVLHYVKKYKEGVLPITGERQFHQSEGSSHGAESASKPDSGIH